MCVCVCVRETCLVACWKTRLFRCRTICEEVKGPGGTNLLYMYYYCSTSVMHWIQWGGGGSPQEIHIQIHSISDFTALLLYYHHLLFLVLLAKSWGNACIPTLCMTVMWFGFLCAAKDQKARLFLGPLLLQVSSSQPDPASLSTNIPQEAKGLFLHYLSHESRALWGDMGSVVTLCCVFMPLTQNKPVSGWRIRFGCVAVWWLGPSSHDPCVCV